MTRARNDIFAIRHTARTWTPLTWVALALCIFSLESSHAETAEQFYGDMWIEGGVQEGLSNAQPWELNTPTIPPTSTPTSTATVPPTASPTATTTPTPTPSASGTPTALPTHTPTPRATDTPTTIPTSTHTPTVTATPTLTPTSTPVVALGDFGSSFGLNSPDAIVDLISVANGLGRGKSVTIFSPLIQARIASITLPNVVADAAAVIAPNEGVNTLAAAWHDRKNRQFLFARFNPETGDPIEAMSVPNKVGNLALKDAVTGCRFRDYALQAVTINGQHASVFIYGKDLRKVPRKLRLPPTSLARCISNRSGSVSTLMSWLHNRKSGKIALTGWNSQRGTLLYKAPMPPSQFSRFFPFTVPASGSDGAPLPGFLALDKASKSYRLYVYNYPSRSWLMLDVPGLGVAAPVSGVRSGWLEDGKTIWVAILFRSGGYLLTTWQI